MLAVCFTDFSSILSLTNVVLEAVIYLLFENDKSRCLFFDINYDLTSKTLVMNSRMLSEWKTFHVLSVCYKARKTERCCQLDSHSGALARLIDISSPFGNS